jgi:hypothetical protein
MIERDELIGEQHPGFVEQPADDGRLAVVNRSADDESQQALTFLSSQEVVEVERRGIRLDVHQKYPSCFLRSIAALPS